MQDTVNAFTDIFILPGAQDGPLKGLTCAVKDIYDIEGHVTTFGCPDWAKDRPAAAGHAVVVKQILDAGADIIGKTQTDEMAYSLIGRNAHYGTPTNSAAAERAPGGSSSGSAAAVAAGLADIALGSDTGGSIRAPASFCGLYGIRPTHGRLDMTGAMPLAESFDVCGWFARGAADFARTGLAFGMNAGRVDPAPRFLIAQDLFADAGEDITQALRPLRRKFEAVYGHAESITLAGGGLAHGFEVFRTVQAWEAWRAHGEWIRKNSPSFGPGVRERFAFAASVTVEQKAWADRARAEMTQDLVRLLGANGVIMTPTVPVIAPYRDSDEASLDGVRRRIVEFTSFAGIAKLPQISIPAGRVKGAPVGLSLLAGPGRDEELLALAAAIETA